jgi:integrase
VARRALAGPSKAEAERWEPRAARAAAGDRWIETGFVFTTAVGTPFEPRNFNRRFDTRCARSDVRKITVHDVRHTCATLLAALDVHPRVAM